MTVLFDGLALGAMPEQVIYEASRLKIVALVHLPLAAEVGLDRETADALDLSERRALAAVSLIVVTGQSTVAVLAESGVAPDRIALVEPGTDRAPLASGSLGAPLHLLSVASVTPGKGHEILIRALATVPQRDWLLTCAGSLDRNPEAVTRLRALLRATDLEQHVSLTGELDAQSLEICYNCADLVVLATLRETYCMAVAEALAHGLPIVSTTTGAIPNLAEAEGNEQHAGLLAPPGDVDALAAALSRVLGNPRLRGQLADGARRVRDRLPTWDDAADRMITALEHLTWQAR